MNKTRDLSFTIKKYINTVLVVIPFAVSWFAYYEPITRTMESRQVTVLMLVVYTFGFYWLCHRMDGFRPSTAPLDELIFNQLISVAVTDFFAFILIWMLSVHFPYLLPGILAFLAQCAIVPIICSYRYHSFFKNHPPHKAIVIKGARRAVDKLIKNNDLENRFDIQAIYDIRDVLPNLDVLDGVEAVFLFGIHSHDRNVVLKECTYRGIQLYIMPRVGDLMMSATEDMHMLHLPILRSKRYNPTLEYRAVKRLADLIFSSVTLVLLSPLFLAVSLAVKSDGGPVFYKQVRLTKDGKKFNILKFRSMCVDAEKYSGAVLSAGEDDPRITKVGRIIRALRLDELPQLLNILKGEMTIVGPRPERPEIAAEYEKKLPEFALRLQTKAGLTGYAQVYGKYNSLPYDKLLMDLFYIAHPSVFQDMKIILQTLKILFDKESTEGGDPEAEESNVSPEAVVRDALKDELEMDAAEPEIGAARRQEEAKAAHA